MVLQMTFARRNLILRHRYSFCIIVWTSVQYTQYLGGSDGVLGPEANACFNVCSVAQRVRSAMRDACVQEIPESRRVAGIERMKRQVRVAQGDSAQTFQPCVHDR